jgi:F-type H+-transporting ATPase subunit delta
MSILVAKKYVKALINKNDVAVTSQINNQLKVISSAFTDIKFNNIISSIDIDTDSKVILISSFIKDINENLNNLLKLLGQNKRLNIIPIISSELNNQVSILTNRYEGIIYSNKLLNDNYINSITSGLENKLNIELSLINVVNDYNGIKVDIEGLGVEISFAKNIFKSQMIEYILKVV